MSKRFLLPGETGGELVLKANWKFRSMVKTSKYTSWPGIVSFLAGTNSKSSKLILISLVGRMFLHLLNNRLAIFCKQVSVQRTTVEAFSEFYINKCDEAAGLWWQAKEKHVWGPPTVEAERRNHLCSFRVSFGSTWKNPFLWLKYIEGNLQYSDIHIWWRRRGKEILNWLYHTSDLSWMCETNKLLLFSF